MGKGTIKFPAGLLQPSGAHRFGLDALLVAAFVKDITEKNCRPRLAKLPIIELGCGCGASSLALGICGFAITGLEKEAELYEAALANAGRLGLEMLVTFENCDCMAGGERQKLLEKYGCAGIVFANPPWYGTGAGRLSAAPLKQRARTTHAQTFFCPAAYSLLIHRGLYCVILPTSLFGAYHKVSGLNGMGLRLILPLMSHAESCCKRLLIMTQKDAADDLRLLAPLVLHESDGTWTKEAREFCPWL